MSENFNILDFADDLDLRKLQEINDLAEAERAQILEEAQNEEADFVEDDYGSDTEREQIKGNPTPEREPLAYITLNGQGEHIPSEDQQQNVLPPESQEGSQKEGGRKRKLRKKRKSHYSRRNQNPRGKFFRNIKNLKM